MSIRVREMWPPSRSVYPWGGQRRLLGQIKKSQRVDYRPLIGMFSLRVELVTRAQMLGARAGGMNRPLHSLCLSAGRSTAFPKSLMEQRGEGRGEEVAVCETHKLIAGKEDGNKSSRKANVENAVLVYV